MSFLDKAKAKVDAVIHPDRHNTTGTTTGSTNAGPHDSNLANKADPRVDSDLDGGRHAGLNQTTGTTGTTGLTGSHHTTGTGLTGTHGSTNAGPHSSNLANKADPRVDSDLDGGRHAGLNQTTGTTGTGLTGSHHTTGTTGTGLTGSHNTTGSGLTGSSGAKTTAGPHSSDLANKLDPRVDSDLSGGHLGSDAQFTHTGTTGSSGFTGNSGTNYGSTHTGTTGSSGLTGTSGTTYGSTNAGPHSSNLANKVDPRVDSDLDGGRHAGLNQTTGTGTGLTGSHHTTGTGLTGTHGSTNAGPHSSNFANAADPRVDSDLDGSRNAGLNQTTHGHTGHSGTTTGTSTQPVHNSNLLNKLDPRVNTGSGTTGSSSTHQPLDAAKHKPSEFPQDAISANRIHRHSVAKAEDKYGSGI